MNLISDDKAQVGAIWVVLLGIFIIGVLIVAMGPYMQNIEDTNNDLINNSDMHYTQAHVDVMTTMFDFWWAYPIYVILLFVIYGIVQSMRRKPGEV